MQANFADRTIWTGNNLDVLRGMKSWSVDLICLDQPYNSNRNYSVPVGSAVEGDGGVVTGANIDGQDRQDGGIAT